MGWRGGETDSTGSNKGEKITEEKSILAGNMKVELWIRDLRRGYRCDQLLCVFNAIG